MSILENMYEPFQRAGNDLRKILFGVTEEEKQEYKKMADSLNRYEYYSRRDKYEQENGLQDKTVAQENNPILAYGFLLIVLALLLKILK